MDARSSWTDENPRRWRGIALGLACCSALFLAAGPTRAATEAKPADPNAQPRTTMHRVFQALAVLLPIGVSEDEFANPARKAEIEKALAMLAGATKDLDAHASSRDADFRDLSRSLAADIEEIRYRFDRGHPEQARYFLLESTKNCVACHSRVPSAREFPLADQLTARIDLERMSAHERAQLQVATRQFDAALTTWEELFADPRVSSVELDIGGYLLDYLTVAIRVQRDTARPDKTLARFLQRDEVPIYLARQIGAWREDLKKHGKYLQGKPSLSRARDLIDHAVSVEGIRGGRDRMVRDLVASSVLLRFIDQASREQGKHDDKLAEAYYLLGIAETRSVGAFWVPRAEFHYEAAIRLDPDGPHAVDAFALLEESIAIGYGGSSGVHLPADVWARLKDLEGLIAAPASH